MNPLWKLFWVYTDPLNTYYYRGTNNNICRVCLKRDTIFRVPHIKMGKQDTNYGMDGDYLLFDSVIALHLKQKVKFFSL